MKYRKKPVVIESLQWTGANKDEIMSFCPSSQWEEIPGYEDQFNLSIPTLEGVHYAARGDFIIKGLKGEFYPCKPDIFEASYDLVE